MFQICNQPAILGFRMHDLLTGESMAQEVTQGYQQAWAQFGRLGGNGHYNTMIAEDTRVGETTRGSRPGWMLGAGTLMNMWNRDFVHAHYPAQIADWLVREPEGMMSVRSFERPIVTGQKIINDDSTSDGRPPGHPRWATPRFATDCFSMHSGTWRRPGEAAIATTQ